jgi:DNA-binding CsgD family transcriptional regulator/PAS domain-containing protein
VPATPCRTDQLGISTAARKFKYNFEIFLTSFTTFHRVDPSLPFDPLSPLRDPFVVAEDHGPNKRLSELIGLIYDAMLDPELWPDALAQIAEFVHGSAAGLFWKDVSSDRGDCIFAFGLEPRYVRLYFERYAKLNRVSNGQLPASIDVRVATGGIIPYDEVLKTREWTGHERFVDCVTAILDKSATSVATLAIFRDERYGIADANMRRRMHLIVPHVRRAVFVAKTLDLKGAQAASFADTLDGIAAATFLVDAAGRIVYVNAAARALVKQSIAFRLDGQRLVATDREANRAFADVFAAVGNCDPAIGARGVTLTLATHGGERYVAHAFPLRSGERGRVENKNSAAAVLFVYSATPNALSCPGAIMEAYKLTPAELRVLLAIVEVGGIPAVAKSLGVGTETVKTHLRRVFQKTGASRQLDLAKIVGSFSSPLLI